MSTAVTIKLNKAANQFQAGESTGFGIRGGVQYYDRETQQKEWTNYEAVVFAKAPAQIQFYQQALVEGAIVEISGPQQKIRQFQGNSGLSLSIEILNAQLGFVGQSAPQNTQQYQPQPQQGYQQPAPQGNVTAAMQQRQPAPQQPAPSQGFGQPTGQPAPAPQGFDDFDPDIPF